MWRKTKSPCSPQALIPLLMPPPGGEPLHLPPPHPTPKEKPSLSTYKTFFSWCLFVWRRQTGLFERSVIKESQKNTAIKIPVAYSI